jgi:Holliday junction resolvasome RuvABC ATP-dependent DNA helicase subunit
MKFVELKYWDDKDISKLFELITKPFNINLPTGFDLKLIQHSKGSPRYIKKYFRNVLAIEKFDEVSLNEMLKETDRELNY